MVISEGLNSSFENNRQNSIITAEKARQLLLQYNLGDEVANKVAGIITGEYIEDVSNPKVVESIKELSNEVNILNSKKDINKIVGELLSADNYLDYTDSKKAL